MLLCLIGSIVVVVVVIIEDDEDAAADVDAALAISEPEFFGVDEADSKRLMFIFEPFITMNVKVREVFKKNKLHF